MIVHRNVDTVDVEEEVEEEEEDMTVPKKSEAARVWRRPFQHHAQEKIEVSRTVVVPMVGDADIVVRSMYWADDVLHSWRLRCRVGPLLWNEAPWGS